MNYSGIIVVFVVVLAAVLGPVLARGGLNPPEGIPIPKRIVYHRRSEDGNNQLTSLAQASKICSLNGGRVAKKAELIEFMNLYGLEECGIGVCGFESSGRVFSVGCGAGDVEQCPDDPHEHGLDGYDVYCYGLPPRTAQEDIELPIRHREKPDEDTHIPGAHVNKLIPDQAFCHLHGLSCAFQMPVDDWANGNSLADCFKACLDNGPDKCKSIVMGNYGRMCNMKGDFCHIAGMIQDELADYFEYRPNEPCPAGAKPITREDALKGIVEGIARGDFNARNLGVEEFPGTGMRFCPVGRANSKCDAIIPYATVSGVKSLKECKKSCVDDSKCRAMNYGGPEGCQKLTKACRMNGLTRSAGSRHYSKTAVGKACGE